MDNCQKTADAAANIRLAAERFRDAAGSAKDKLLTGGWYLWESMLDEDVWPSAMLADANQAIGLLLQHGTISQTVDHLNEEGAESTAERVGQLVAHLDECWREIEGGTPAGC